MSKKKFIVELDPDQHPELCEVIKNHGGVEAQSESGDGGDNSDPNSPSDKPKP